MNFYETSNAMDKEPWIELYWHLVDQHGSHIGKGPLDDPQYHNKLVQLLRKVGMNDEANEIEIVRISDDDIRHGNTPFDSSLTIGGLLKHVRNQERDRNFSAAYSAYHTHLESIANTVYEHIKKMDWEGELDGQYDLRYPEGEADLHRHAKNKGYELSSKFIGGRTGWKYFILKDKQGNAIASGKMEDIEDFLGR
jgi:hypothetical protein